MKIGIDGRRNFGSGIGRVTSNVIEGLINYDSENEYTLFVSQPRIREANNVRFEVCNIPFFSEADLYGIPELIARAGLDVFVSPQFYISPFIGCPTVKFVHDLWPLLYREWVPSYDDFLSHFGSTSAQGIRVFLEHFDALYAEGALFSNNEFLSRILANPKLKLTERYVAAMMACTLWTAQRIVVPSDHTRNEIAAAFPEVLPNVRMATNFPSPVFRTRSNATKGLFILHVAKWEPRKNVEHVLRVGQLIYEHFGIGLVLVGDQGYRAYGREIKKAISCAPYTEFVRHLGVVSDEELAELYRTAQVFIFPSLYEGFGIPPLEAMACGTPVVAANSSALPEVCGDAAILVDATDPKMTYSAIASLLTNEKLYAENVQKGLLRAHSFERSRVIRSLLRTIEEAAQTRGAIGIGRSLTAPPPPHTT